MGEVGSISMATLQDIYVYIIIFKRLIQLYMK